jgi:hypothetical protein
MVETGADTGTFMGSIQVATSGGTLEFERIQTTEGDTLRITHIDEINTTGFPRIVTDTASVVTTITPTPTPAIVPTLFPSPTPSVSPTPSLCEAGSITVSPPNLTLKRNKSGDVTVTVTGLDDCAVEGETVTATINPSGKKRISVLPTIASTDENGHATFTITARKKTGSARVTFRVDELKKSMTVKVKK